MNALWIERTKGNCELCHSSEQVNIINVSPKSNDVMDEQVALCTKCASEMEHLQDTNHFRCLSDSIWSEQSPVKVLSYRILQSMKDHDWAQDIVNMAYLTEDELYWAQNIQKQVVHLDSNGQQILDGDTVVLIQDLDVKGANFVAKRGTTVKKVRLVSDNAEQIEGKVNDQSIVILTKYVRKA